MTHSFANKVVVVTGASTDIGRVTAQAFRSAGARVVLAARTADQLEQLAAEMGGPAVALPVPTEISDPAQCQALMARAADHFGRIDVLINNAGMLVSGKFEYLEPGDLERQFDVNLLGPMYCARSALPHLKASGGVIVNVSSVAALLPVPSASAYAASKAALNSWSQALRVELQPYGIAVATVCPYFTKGAELSQKGIIRDGSRHRTEGKSLSSQAPGKQSMEEVAQAILRATEQRAGLVVLSRYGRLIWHINRFAPGLINWALTRAFK